MAVGLMDGSVKLWDRASGAQRWSNDASMDAEIELIQFMPGDKQLIVTPRLKNSLQLNPRPALMLDARNGAVRHTFAHGSVLGKFGFSQDQRWGITGGQDNRIQLWDLHTGAPVETMRASDLSNTHCIAISAQNRWMVTGTAGTMTIFDAQRWERLKIVGEASTDLHCTLLFEEGAATVLHSTASGLSRWSIPGGQRLTHATHKPHVRLIPSPDGRSLLEHDERGAALTDLATLKRRATLEGHQGRIMDAAFSPDGAQLITASTDNTARIWSGTSGEPLLTLRGHTSWVFSAALVQDGDQPVAVTGGRDGMLRQWSLPGGTARSILPNHDSFERLTLSRDWSKLIIQRDEHREIWRIDQDEPALLASQPASRDASSSFSADGVWFASVDYARSFLIHEGEELPLPRHEGRPGQVRVASDGSVVSAFGVRFSFWRPGQEAWSYHSLPEQLDSCAISADGALIAVATQNDLHVVREGESKLYKRAQPKRPETISAMFISPDKRWLVMTTWGGELEVWDLEQERQLERAVPHADSITRVALMPDGSGFLTSSLDRTIKRWSWGKLTPEATLRGHEIDILALAISPDGRRLASGDKEGLVIVWDLVTAQALHARWATNAVEALHFTQDGLEGLDMGQLRWRWSLTAQAPAASNYRVCRATGAVVPVVPFPPANTVWAPEDACR
jgi:WD40 repeat protein